MRVSTIWQRSLARQLLTPSRSGSGPRSTRALERRQLAVIEPGRSAALGRSRRPSTPSALNRITQSRSVWRSMPAWRAARSRLIPSNALATPSRRHATRPSLLAGQTAQLLGCDVVTDRCRCAHRSPRCITHAAQRTIQQHIYNPGKSKHRRVGIRPWSGPLAEKADREIGDARILAPGRDDREPFAGGEGHLAREGEGCGARRRGEGGQAG
jgi:hypothetical protein